MPFGTLYFQRNIWNNFTFEVSPLACRSIKHRTLQKSQHHFSTFLYVISVYSGDRQKELFKIESNKIQRKVNPQCLSYVNHSNFETFVLFVLFLPFLTFMCMCRFFFELDLMLNRILFFSLPNKLLSKHSNTEYWRKPENEGKGKGARPYSVIVQRNRVIWCSY